jgi:hypothetical protein
MRQTTQEDTMAKQTLNPPCRDCGTRASQSAYAVKPIGQRVHGGKPIGEELTIRQLVGDLPLHYCTVCAMFNAWQAAAERAGETVQILGHDMVERTACNGNSPGGADAATQ